MKTLCLRILTSSISLPFVMTSYFSLKACDWIGWMMFRVEPSSRVSPMEPRNLSRHKWPLRLGTNCKCREEGLLSSCPPPTLRASVSTSRAGNPSVAAALKLSFHGPTSSTTATGSWDRGGSPARVDRVRGLDGLFAGRRASKSVLDSRKSVV